MPPWNSTRPRAPKPLMSSPVPPPPNLSRGPPPIPGSYPWNASSPGNQGMSGGPQPYGVPGNFGDNQSYVYMYIIQLTCFNM